MLYTLLYGWCQNYPKFQKNNFVRPKAVHVYLVALKCCLCICATLSPHSFINSDINSCALGYFLVIYQPWWSNA